METIRPENTDPTSAASPPPDGTIIIRFTGLLLLAILVMALIWSR